MMKFATIYLLRNELGAAVYVGSTFHTLPWRFARHRSACKCDPCSPLHRYGVEHGDMEGWTIEAICRVPYAPGDQGQVKHLVTTLENASIAMHREQGAELLNDNRAAARPREAARTRGWRERHGQGQRDSVTGLSLSYMAIKGRERRARLRQAKALERAASEAVKTEE